MADTSSTALLLGRGQDADQMAGIGHNGGPPLDPPPVLVDYYDDYCPKRFPRARSRRAKQAIARKYKLPVIRIGQATLINPPKGDRELEKFAAYQQPGPGRRGRGRPRTAAL